MNPDALTHSAARLRNVATMLVASGHLEVEPFFAALRPLIERAIAQKIAIPMDWNGMPGGLHFAEGTFRKYVELEQAYADFKVEITGGESTVLMRLSETLNRK